MKLSELFESLYANKWGYSKIQFAAIRLWGGVLYLDYDSLPLGQGNLDQFSVEVNDYLSALKSNDEDAIVEFEEWCQEGAKKGGKSLLTKQVFDSILHSAERTIDKEIVIFKSGKKNHTSDRWISTTLAKGRYSDLGDEQQYTLPVGTKVIFADGIADEDEVIIHTSKLPKNFS